MAASSFYLPLPKLQHITCPVFPWEVLCIFEISKHKFTSLSSLMGSVILQIIWIFLGTSKEDSLQFPTNYAAEEMTSNIFVQVFNMCVIFIANILP